MSTACIIIPTWNSSSIIEDCIQSVRMQTLSDIECIIVDDGSEDDTVQKVEKNISGDRRMKLFKQKHQGLSAARNAGIEASSSDIIFHLDSDDLAKPEMVERVVEFLSKNNLDIAFFNAEVINCGAHPVIFEVEREYFKRKKHYGIMSGRKFLELMLHCNDWVYASFIQASKKSKIRRKFPLGLRAQDEVCTIENLLLAENVGHINEILYTKRCFPFSVSKRRKDAHYAWSRMKAIQELMKFVDEEHIEDPDILLLFIEKMARCVVEGLWKLRQEDIEWMKELSFTDRTMMYLFGMIHSNKCFNFCKK